MTDNSSDTPNGVDTGLGEPSMEDILASIRRIIAEDEDGDQKHFDVDAVVKPEVVEAPEVASAIEDSIADNVEKFVASDDGEDVLLLDQLVADAGLDVGEANAFETDELIIDPVDAEGDGFNPVSSVMNELEDKLNDDKYALEDLDPPDDDNVVFSLDTAPDKMSPGSQLSNSILSMLQDDPAPVVESDKTEMDSSDDLESDALETDAMEFELEDLIQSPAEPEPISDVLGEEDLEIDIQEESDLDIVKSLMADLADTSFLDDTVSDEAILDDMEVGMDAGIEASVDEEIDLVGTLTDSLLIDDSEAPIEAGDSPLDGIEGDALVLTDTDSIDSEEEQDQIINDILELAIQDEQAAATTFLEETDHTLDDELTIPDFDESEPQEDSVLLQIAAEAEADADAMDGNTIAATVVGSAAIAAVAVENISDAESVAEMDITGDDTPSTEELLSELDLALAEVTQDDNQESTELVVEPVSETDLIIDVEAEIEADTTDLFVEPEEIEDMPRTARKDAIINEVTEEATAGAFAELSQAVEEKAVFTESGPRIGDLVQDALRPMLQEWLDENLKGIVERAVAKEVKRIASGK